MVTISTNRRHPQLAGWTLLILTLLFSAALSDPAPPEVEDVLLLRRVVEWACNEHNGGWMSPKVEIRPIGNDGLSGIFAKEPLPPGESVVEIPWSLIHKPSSENATRCEKVETLRQALLHPQTPYDHYLVSRSKHKTPFYWSPASKELLKELFLGMHSTGFARNHEESFRSNCKTPMEQSHVDASVLLDTRGEGESVDLLVPIGDLLNHRNGNHTNVDPKVTQGIKYEIITTRAIQAGEQLQNSYNQCQWCRMYSNPLRAFQFYVTPQLFEIYGFVELMPQRWIIPSQRLLFDIDETDDGRLQATFVVKPSRRGIVFLQRRWQALQDFKRRHQYRTDLPPSELEALMSFRDAAALAFRLAVQAAEEEGTSELIWKLPINKWYWEY